MDLGTTLRTARERRNLSLAHLSAITKIPIALLHAIEDNRFEKVPPGIFIRGYIRSYAHEVDLDPEEMVQQYLDETGQAVPFVAEEQRGSEQPIEEDIDALQIDPDRSGSGPGWGYVLIVAALIVAIVSFNRSSEPEEQTAVSSEPIEALPAVPAPTLTAAVAVPDPLQPVATAGAGLRFEIHAQGPCWVEAVVDGQKTVYRLMQPGEQETLDAQQEIILRVGDPGTLTYSVNGKPGQPFGRPGVPVTVRLTSEGELVELVS